MSKSQNVNGQIAKNTLFLYFRMLLTIFVGLYTSRVVLNVLGVSDYGIHNVVGGIVNMVAFLNVGMMGASQRFLSYAIGKDSIHQLEIVFRTSVTTHMLIALIILLLAETIGIWFLNTYMNIPEGRLFAANWVYQCSILTFIVTVLSVPYNSCIVAHEHMNIYAYVSIFEVLFKLVIVFCLVYFPNVDRLVLYSSLLLLVQVSVRVIYTYYCRSKFIECRSKVKSDRDTLKRMFSFAGWGMVGNLGFTFKDQGSNIILNLFFGTTVNAARGIAGQVNAIINGFASNFSMAMNPQITKRYASGDTESSMRLVYSGSRFTFYLLGMIIIPFLINSNYVLRLWLGIVPEYTEMFLYFILIGSLLYSLSHTVSTAILATGNVKWFQLLLALILLSELPIAYIILLLGGKPYHAMIPSLFTIFLSLILRICIIKRYIPKYSFITYMFGVVLRCVLTFVICFVLCYKIRSYLPESIVTVLTSTVISFIVNTIIIISVGITGTERSVIIKKVRLKLNK